MIRVLLAEDHETVREGLRLLLNAQPDITVVGEAGDGQSAIDLAHTLRPDVLVLDLTMPRMSGLMVAREFAAHPGPAVVALTRHDDDAYVQELLATAHAMGYVLKQSPSTVLLEAIRSAASGVRFLDPALPSPASERKRVGRCGSPRLTERETEVLRMTATGHSNKDIAAALDISVKTAEVHKANAMRKMGLRGRTDVVRYAVLNGWLRDPLSTGFPQLPPPRPGAKLTARMTAEHPQRPAAVRLAFAPRPFVLVVEDDADTRLLMSVILEGQGFEVAACEDGGVAIEAARRRRPDVVILDVSLPTLDGWSVARALRTERGTCQVPIVMVSGHCDEEHHARARAEGCSDYLCKPVDVSHLVEVVRHLADKPREALPA